MSGPRLVTILAGVVVILGTLPWAYSLLSGTWISRSQQAKWESRAGGTWTSGRIRLMGLGGVLVALGIGLGLLAIAGLRHPEILVLPGLGLVAIGAVVSALGRRSRAVG